MAVIGTGTAEDPYIVNNWTDFCSVKDKTGKYIFWEDLPTDQKIVDLNEEVPNGYNGWFGINSRQVDFNGWTIRNLSIYAPDSTAPIVFDDGNHTLKNGKFLNCNFSAHGPIRAEDASTLEDCVVTGVFNSTGYNTSNDYNFIRSIVYIRCAINMNVNIFPAGYVDWEPALINSIVRLNVLSQSTWKDGNAFSICYGSIYYNNRYLYTHDSKIVLSLKKTEDGTANKVTIVCSGNNVFIIDSEIPCTFAEPRAHGAISLVRSDNPNDVYSYILYKSVTDEQLKDPDYLYSLGFPIATGVGS